MSGIHEEASGSPRNRTRFEPIASLTVHPTLRIVVESGSEHQDIDAKVVSATFQKGTTDLEDVLIRISDRSLTANDDDDESIGYDWEALAEFPADRITRNPIVRP